MEGDKNMGRGRSRSHRKWEDMNYDILAHIFTLLTCQDLLFNVSLVCTSWKKVCWDKVFWKSKETLDLSSLRYAMLDRDFYLATQDYDSLALRWMKLLHRIMIDEDRVQFATSIVFSCETDLSDKHLVYVAQRTPGLKKLYLPAASLINGKGFSRAIRNWKGLEEIFLGHISISDHYHIIKEIGINCKKLKSLCLDSSYSLDGFNSVLLTENLKALKQLTLQKLMVSKDGLFVLLSKSKGLEKVHIKLCLGMEADAGRFFSWLELKRTIVNKQIKWAIVPEEGLHSPGDMVSLLYGNDRTIVFKP